MKITNYLDKSIWPSLLLFPSVNVGLFLFFFGENNVLVNSDIMSLIEQAFILFAVAFAEELFFRGLLLRELIFGYCLKPMLAAIIVSLLFGALHILNIFSYATMSYAIVQGFCAFAIGFDLAAIYCRFRSVVPCILVHAVINITSIGLDGKGTKLAINNVEAIIFFSIAILYLIHGYESLKARSLST